MEHALFQSHLDVFACSPTAAFFTAGNKGNNRTEWVITFYLILLVKFIAI